MSALRVWCKAVGLVFVAFISSFLSGCGGEDWDDRLVGEWVEYIGSRDWPAAATFSVSDDHSLIYDINDACGTGWPKYGRLLVNGNRFQFQVDEWSGSDDRYLFEFSGDSLILTIDQRRTAFYRASLDIES